MVDQLKLLGEAPVRCGEIEQWAREAGHSVLIGLDEAGRGPLAGPVLAAACVLPDPCPIDGLNDSKKLSERKREALFEAIVQQSTAYAIVAIEPKEIDTLNILQASLKAMGMAWRQVVEAHPEFQNALVLVDGNQRAHLPGEVDQRPIIKGDGRSLNIAAASILAKVSRDRRMMSHHEQWPQYGFDRHKGYPTTAHRRAIAQHGPSPIHRRSFKLPERIA